MGWCIRQDAFIIITKGISPFIGLPQKQVLCSQANIDGMQLLLASFTKRTVYCGEVTPLIQSGVYGQSPYAYGLLYALFVILEYHPIRGKSRKKSCELIVKPSKVAVKKKNTAFYGSMSAPFDKRPQGLIFF